MDPTATMVLPAAATELTDWKMPRARCPGSVPKSAPASRAGGYCATAAGRADPADAPPVPSKTRKPTTTSTRMTITARAACHTPRRTCQGPGGDVAMLLATPPLTALLLTARPFSLMAVPGVLAGDLAESLTEELAPGRVPGRRGLAARAAVLAGRLALDTLPSGLGRLPVGGRLLPFGPRLAPGALSALPDRSAAQAEGLAGRRGRGASAGAAADARPGPPGKPLSAGVPATTGGTGTSWPGAGSGLGASAYPGGSYR